jgi:hypothetical protein
MTRYALCLLLLCTTSMVNARDVRMHGANGDGGACPEAAAVALAATTSPVRHVPSAVNRGKAKAPTLFRGGDEDTGSHTPRWHSFLPGMFR